MIYIIMNALIFQIRNILRILPAVGFCNISIMFPFCIFSSALPVEIAPAGADDARKSSPSPHLASKD